MTSAITPTPAFVPFPPIERLGVISDRRSAAMVAADGTICWWCLPNFDGDAVFGALLDAHKGGYFRFGPRQAVLGAQSYLPDTAALLTRWEGAGGCLEAADVMLWPEKDRPPGLADRRVIVRRLRCLAGRVHCTLSLVPRPDFAAAAATADGAFAPAGRIPGLAFWSSIPTSRGGGRIDAAFELAGGDEVWAVVESGGRAADWTLARARDGFAGAVDYWRRWLGRLDYRGPRSAAIRQSAMLVHLLSFAPTGAPIAAPTTSLPERVGGGRNYDYRYSWIRDASLSLSLLAELGFTGDEKRYLDWLTQLPPGEIMPLQTVYSAVSGTAAPVRVRDDLSGYRQSRPVQFGNAAFDMEEIGSFGYLADCIWTYIERDGPWQDSYWQLVRRIADFAAAHWRDRGTGIWELDRREFVTTKVLSWTTIDRALKIAERVRRTDVPVAAWRGAMEAIREDVFTRGWSARMNSFRQHYGADSVDAALLLIPLLDFLPPDDPRVEGTVAQIEARLTINGFVYRFVEEEFPAGRLPLGEEEGSFAMCTCWLAHYYAKRGDLAKADAILNLVEATTRNGLYSEAIDGRSGAQLGNAPLLFTQVEYAKAAMRLAGKKGAL